MDPDIEEVILDYCAHAHLRNVRVACKKNPTQSTDFDRYSEFQTSNPKA